MKPEIIEVVLSQIRGSVQSAVVVRWCEHNKHLDPNHVCMDCRYTNQDTLVLTLDNRQRVWIRGGRDDFEVHFIAIAVTGIDDFPAWGDFIDTYPNSPERKA